METDTSSGKAIVKGLLLSSIAAAIVTVLFVLPAEYGRDFTGIGDALGLTGIAMPREQGREPLPMDGAFPAIAENFDEYEPPVVGLPFSANQERTYRRESIPIVLQPGEQVEYKAVMQRGNMLVWSWTSDAAEIYSDFHADPTDRPGEYPEGYFVRYAESEAPEAHGSIVAPFAGNHGWYWLNYNEETVNIELSVTGYYDEVHELGRSFQY